MASILSSQEVRLLLTCWNVPGGKLVLVHRPEINTELAPSHTVFEQHESETRFWRRTTEASGRASRCRSVGMQGE